MSRVVDMKGEPVDPQPYRHDELTCARRDARLWRKYCEEAMKREAYWEGAAREWKREYEGERATRLELIKQLALRPWWRRWI